MIVVGVPRETVSGGTGGGVTPGGAGQVSKAKGSGGGGGGGGGGGVLGGGGGGGGLQAIATARRLGAVVSAFDVRAAVKEQVQSVGAKFVELPLDGASGQDSNGYAKALTDEQQRRQ